LTLRSASELGALFVVLDGKPAVVILGLGGGLGNQLFQYAFGRRMALANHASLQIDASGFEHMKHPNTAIGERTLSLNHFRIAGTFMRRAGPPPWTQTWLRRKVIKQWNRLSLVLERRKPYYMRREVWEPEENHFRFDRCLYERRVAGSVSFHGYWQTEKYFREIEHELRRELVVEDPMKGENLRLGLHMESCEAVAIHVRHGDNAGAAAALGVLSLGYYQAAVRELRREVHDPHLFVFSDDTDWARTLIDFDVPTVYVSHNSATQDYEDLRLMAICKHHVLANSTFSWWGAWLGKKPGQIVYAPRRYYQNVDRPNPDLYPETWRLL
jgi:hypothetical protein